MAEQQSGTRSNEFNAQLVEQFRANGGEIVDGPYRGAPLLLLTTKGARTGKALVKPLAYSHDADHLVVVASKSGSPTHPDWYRNLIAEPTVIVEVGRDRFPAHARRVLGPERERLYAAHARVFPIFLDYQRRTNREIPVIVLERML
jgi:deazaflavin-dependent oxidoreductase (nitroreductase family)